MSAQEIITRHLDLWTSAITHKSTAGRGTNGKIELTGIKKLRELILELAVRGKLVPQNPEDEPASELLRTAHAWKLQSTQTVKANPNPVGSKDQPFPLPAGWEFSRFSEVLDFQGGSQPPKSRFATQSKPNYVQLIQIRDLGPNPQPVYVPRDSVSKFCSSHDIMIGRYGASVGKVFWGKDGAYNVALIKLINDCGIYANEFLFYLMVSPLGQSYFLGISRSAQDGFSKNDIANCIVPIPPLAEQHRIVEKVDELMALCDRLEQQSSDQIAAHETLVDALLDTLTQSRDATELADNWARLATYFDTLFTTEHSIERLKQTILQLAVMGRLVKQDPEDELAAALIERVSDEKVQANGQRKQRIQKLEPKISSRVKPFEIPNSWAWSPLHNTGFTSTGKTPSTNDPKFFSGDIPFLGPGQITTSSKILAPDKFLSEDGLSASEEALPGDILTVCIGGSIGKTAKITERCGFNQQLNKIRPVLVDSDYLLAALKAEYFQEAILEKATGSATPIINRSKWESIEIPIAPLAEQHRIVQKVDELMSLCDQLKARLNKASETRRHLAETVTEQAIGNGVSNG